jgi:hypothetical protein
MEENTFTINLEDKPVLPQMLGIFINFSDKFYN